MSYAPEDIDRMIAAPQEYENLEFKSQCDTTDLYRYCVAIANEHGGELVLGVTNKIPRAVTGFDSYPDLNKLKSQLFDKLNFRVEVHEVAHPNGRVLVFGIPSRPVGGAYELDGAYLMRVGESTVPMKQDKLRSIFDEGKQEFLLRPSRTNVGEGDIQNLLDTFCYFDLMKTPYPSSMSAVLERFEQNQLVMRHGDGWHITNLGALLFARNLHDFDLQRKAPRVVVYKGTGKFESVRQRIGTKGYAVGFQELNDYINSQLPASEVFEGGLRREVHVYPKEAIRELVANALIHQNLEDRGSLIDIEIYADRVEISNPGKPLISTDRFIDGNKAPNERLAGMMRLLGFCEERGSGIDKVIRSVESCQLPAPDFRAAEHRTSVVLFAPKPFEKMDRNERVRACYQHACLCYLHNQKMTNQSLRERFKLPENKGNTISQVIADTVGAGLIKSDDSENRSKRYAKYAPYWT
jgi:ATP-dependent DNA helicase RecG